MRGARLAIGLLVLAIAPATAFAQAGVTPLLTSPDGLARRQMEIRGYFTIEDDIDLFGVYRRGVGSGLDFGARTGYTDAA
ncbi:MAG: hypothetical protein GWN51_13905, partial [Gemmatimonadetes bacterium]|nr:hypothetical protein [Gemmatimonadota bacterium]NIV24728.1 hypothetical protein [Gemmatimonadota bacterium]NIW76679.1 hypothetical protein [Gemmatimonadota bacterium]